MTASNISSAGALHVLTVHFNTPDLTSDLVRRLIRRTPRGREVFVRVLDNGSTPQNLAALRAGIDGFPGVALDVSEQNLGFGEGVNRLVQQPDIADSDIIWLLNPDTRPGPGCLQTLEEVIDTEDFAVVSPLIFSGGTTDTWIWYCGGQINMRTLRARHQFYGRSLANAPRQLFETSFVSGAAPMMRASTFRAIGGFPHDYFLYWEDAYFSWRARKLGLRLAVAPSAQLWHAVGASSGLGQSATFYYWSTRNRFVFANDVGLSGRRLVFGLGGVESIRPVAKALLEQDGRVKKLSAAVRGTVQGLKVMYGHR